MKSSLHFKNAIIRLSYVWLLSAVLLFLTFQKAYANTFSYQANETWNAASCTFSVNGSPLLYEPAQNGDTVSVVVTDNTPQNTDFFMNVNFSGDANHGGTQGPYNIGPGQSTTVTFNNIQSNSFIYISGGDCNNGNTTDSYFWIKPATATLACNTVPSGKTYAWDISGSYSNILSGAIYNGTSNDGTTAGGSGGINETYVADSYPTTFYFYDGDDSSGRLLAQASCIAGAYPTQAPTSTSTTPQSTSTPVATAIGNSPTPSDTTPSASTTVNNSQTTINPKAPTNLINAHNTLPKKVTTANTAILVGSGIGVFVIILALFTLGILGIWNVPQHLIGRIWKTLTKILHKDKPLTPPTQAD
jgi:hypothetical protein